MGGFGSGRYEYATTPTVEQCRHLSVDEFTDALTPGTRATVSWGEGEDANSIIVVLEGDAGHDDPHADRVRLRYTVGPGSDDEHTRNYTIPLEYTECNFGGYRPWFRCPGVVDGQHCGERVGKLYLPPRQDLYLCRDCYDLGYRSSRTSGDDVKQAELRYRRAFAKADAQDRRAHPANEPWLPERPKGMHHETFQDLLDDVHAASEDWHDAMQTRMRERTERLSDRYGGVDGLV